MQVTAPKTDCKLSRGNPHSFFHTASLPDQEQSKQAEKRGWKRADTCLGWRGLGCVHKAVHSSDFFMHCRAGSTHAGESILESKKKKRLFKTQVVVNFGAGHGHFCRVGGFFWSCLDQVRSQEMTGSAALVNRSHCGLGFIWMDSGRNSPQEVTIC